ncbi:hypothetical protein ACFY2T_30480 [Streptomyces sp. NPDC001260]|uniref:hypothetical protein n=1 Tax=Streptomyces sp. NPDC001260 TaxID=3364551 RepID=UPI0036820D39
MSTWHDDLRLIDSAPLPCAASRPIPATQVIVADKGFAGREFERFITDRLVAELAPRPPRDGTRRVHAIICDMSTDTEHSGIAH